VVRVEPALDELLWRAARTLARDVDALTFAAPVTHVYNPLRYASAAYREYLRRYATSPKRIVYLGMNPGPWGMAQTGVPFGQIAIVRDWLQISAEIGKPEREHPKRPVEGFSCMRSEVSGARLWGAFAERYVEPRHFFRERFVANYCPLVFMEESGRNRTPADLRVAERRALAAACDRHLRELCKTLSPEWVVGVGKFAAERAADALADTDVGVVEILHPSPASPAANRGWTEQVDAQLARHGLTL
jgi:single-strand selective monofunctional uracil DNA glycosylase